MTALEAIADRVRDAAGDAVTVRLVSEELHGLLDEVRGEGVARLVAGVRAADADWRRRPGPAAADRLAGLVEDLAVAVDAIDA